MNYRTVGLTLKKKTMKHLITILLILSGLLAHAQYQLEWEKELNTLVSSSWVNFSHYDASSVVYNVRWYQNVNDTNRVHNVLTQMSHEGNEIWSYDWNQEFIDHELRLLHSKEDGKIFFIARSTGFNRTDTYIIGLLELGVGVLWQIPKQGLVNTGHLAGHSDLVNEGDLIVISENNDETIMTSYSISGSELWSVDPLIEDPYNATVLRDNEDNIWLLGNERRLIYDVNGNLIAQDSSLLSLVPNYNSGFHINDNNELYQIHWIGNSYFFLGYNEDLDIIQRDTFRDPCPAFGDWQLFLEDDNEGHQYIGGLELCEVNTTYLTSFYRYEDGQVDWSYQTQGMSNGMKLTDELLFYVNGNEIGVLNNEDGTLFWQEIIDTLSIFSDYNYSLLVKEDASEFYTFSTSRENRYYIRKHVLVTNNNENIEPSNYSLYPNPSLGPVYIENLDNSLPLNYELVNTLGQKVSTGKLIDNKLDLSNYQAGVYLLILEGQKPKRLVLH